MANVELESIVARLQNAAWDNLRALLEMILPSWLKEAKFNGRGIRVFVLEDFQIQPNETFARATRAKFPPILVLYPMREREPDRKLPGYREIAGLLPTDIQVAEIIRLFEELLADTKWVEECRCQAECRIRPRDGLWQGDGAFPILGVAFDIDYYWGHLSLFMDYMYTCA